MAYRLHYIQVVCKPVDHSAPRQSVADGFTLHKRMTCNKVNANARGWSRYARIAMMLSHLTSTLGDLLSLFRPRCWPIHATNWYIMQSWTAMRWPGVDTILVVRESASPDVSVTVRHTKGGVSFRAG